MTEPTRAWTKRLTSAELATLLDAKATATSAFYAEGPREVGFREGGWHTGDGVSDLTHARAFTDAWEIAARRLNWDTNGGDGLWQVRVIGLEPSGEGWDPVELGDAARQDAPTFAAAGPDAVKRFELGKVVELHVVRYGQGGVVRWSAPCNARNTRTKSEEVSDAHC